MTQPTARGRRLRRRRGFTAVEIAMVATVIAILALLILPIFRKRTDEAKLAAANDELQSLAKAILIIESDLDGFQPRLQDLDNIERNTATISNVTLDPPIAEWNRTLGFAIDGFTVVADTRPTVIQNWRGPYIAFRRADSVQNIVAIYGLNITYTNGGPIYVVGDDGPNYNGSVSDDAANDRYPLDPWNSPYLFYGRETDFNVRYLVSMGPNGVPGDGVGGPPNPFQRPGTGGAELGTGDDLVFPF